jgi:hypothetical protein
VQQFGRSEFVHAPHAILLAPCFRERWAAPSNGQVRTFTSIGEGK